MAARPISTLQFTLSSNAPDVRVRDSEFTTDIRGGLQLDPNTRWGVRAVSGTAWYSAPNLVLGETSRFAYTYLGAPYAVDLVTGTYTLYDIELAITDLMVTQNGHGTFSQPVFAFGMLDATSQMYWQIQAPHVGYAFAPDLSSIAVWGMPPSTPRETENTSAPARFTSALSSDFTLGVESYVIHADCVTGSYLGGENSDVLFSFPLGSSSGPNTQMTYTSTAATPFLPLASRNLSSITIRVTDNRGAPISLRGEPVTVVLAIESR